MSDYRRIWKMGGTYFFTVCLAHRIGNDLLTRYIVALRHAVKETRARYPFDIDAWVVLPEHLHCVITLPPSDNNYALRWRLIKRWFSEAVPRTEYRNVIRTQRGERGIWQRRYWKHLIRNEKDYLAHIDYIHFNPVKHGLVQRATEWPYSTFHHWVNKGSYPANWGEGGYGTALEFDD
jgi:putative transposase